jgi:hypothetical protein
MADAIRAAFKLASAAPISPSLGTMDSAMIELLYIYQVTRNPLQAMARRWYCRAGFSARRGASAVVGTARSREGRVTIL